MVPGAMNWREVVIDAFAWKVPGRVMVLAELPSWASLVAVSVPLMIQLPVYVEALKRSTKLLGATVMVEPSPPPVSVPAPTPIESEPGEPLENVTAAPEAIVTAACGCAEKLPLLRLPFSVEPLLRVMSRKIDPLLM